MQMCSSKRKRSSSMPLHSKVVCGRCGGSAQVAPRELSEQVASKLSASLVSVASFNGDKMLRACTGICIKTSHASSNTLSVMTSYSLVAYHDGDYTMLPRNFSKIEVGLPNGQIVPGKIGRYSDYFDIAIVNVENIPPGFQVECLSLARDMPFEPYVDVVAAWRCHHTGQLKTTSGTLDEIPEGRFFTSTCKIMTAGLGGALIDYDGKFIGMNNFLHTISEWRATCVPLPEILERLWLFGMLPKTVLEQDNSYGTNKSSTSVTQGYSISFKYLLDHLGGVDLCNYIYKMVTFCGYPLPDLHKAWDGMYLNYTFEEEFGEDCSNILRESVALKVSQSVVSLASFNGKTRYFVCTGVFIGSGAHSARILTSASLVRNSGDDIQNINHNMRIEVRLPNDRRVKGILKYCNLCYNIALVDIMESWSPRIKLQGLVGTESDLVAVGCLFHKHKLMAMKGCLKEKNTVRPHQDCCAELSFSTCKITKAGIGGPLIDMCGNVVGMDFYHEEYTPFLSSKIILDLLKHDFSKDICAECLKDGPVVIAGTNRWPVTEPCWCYESRGLLVEQDYEGFCGWFY